MLCTEGRARLLPLVIYAGDELLEPRHVLEVATRYVYKSTESRSVERGERHSRTVLPLLHPSALAPASCYYQPQHVFFSLIKNQRQNLGIVCQPSSLKPSQVSGVVAAV